MSLRGLVFCFSSKCICNQNFWFWGRKSQIFRTLDYRFNDSGVDAHRASHIGVGTSFKLATINIDVDYDCRVVNELALENGRPKKMTTGPLPGIGPAIEKNAELDSEVIGTKYPCHNQECIARFDSLELLNDHLSTNVHISETPLSMYGYVRRHYIEGYSMAHLKQVAGHFNHMFWILDFSAINSSTHKQYGVEKFLVERAGVEAWGWNVLQPSISSRINHELVEEHGCIHSLHQNSQTHCLVSPLKPNGHPNWIKIWTKF